MIATAPRRPSTTPREQLSLPLALDNTSRDPAKPLVHVVCFACGEAIDPGLGVQAQRRGAVERTGWRPASYRGAQPAPGPGPISLLNVIVHPNCA